MKFKSTVLMILASATLAGGCALEGDLEMTDDEELETSEQSAARCWLEKDGSLNSGCLPVRTEEEWEVFMASNDRSRVRSRGDWDRCVASSTCNPLRGIDPATVADFTRSLVFNRGGLAGARYHRLVNVLSYEQFAVLWNTFGMDPWFTTDYIDKYCSSPGSCMPDIGAVCTSNC